MQLFKHYEQIYKYFAEGKQKDNSAQNSKFLQLHNLKVSDYLTKKYALSLDFRTIDENTLHEARRWKKNVSKEIFLQIRKQVKDDENGMLTYVTLWMISWTY